MRKYILIIFLFAASLAKAQKVDSIYVNLYTDSLKKGTYNYINIDGLMSNGRYLPLDSTDIIFTASAGKFIGNTLWLDKNFAAEKVSIKVVLRTNPALHKEFEIFVKKKENDEKLKTVDEIFNQPSSKNKKNKG